MWHCEETKLDNEISMSNYETLVSNSGSASRSLAETNKAVHLSVHAKFGLLKEPIRMLLPIIIVTQYVTFLSNITDMHCKLSRDQPRSQSLSPLGGSEEKSGEQGPEQGLVGMPRLFDLVLHINQFLINPHMVSIGKTSRIAIG